MKRSLFVIGILISLSLVAQDKKKPEFSGNPLFPGWYADPEGIIFGDTYWIYPTFSDESGVVEPPTAFSDYQLKIRENTINPQYLKQTFFDAFSSKDLIKWDKHPH